MHAWSFPPSISVSFPKRVVPRMSCSSGEENPAEEPPAADQFTEDDVDSLAKDVACQATLNSLRATYAQISIRLHEEGNGSVIMRTETADENIALWSVVRAVSNRAVMETDPRCGWGLSNAQLSNAELFCAWGTGARVSCLVNFELPRRSGSDGTKRRRGAPLVDPGSTNARAGGHVAFKDANGDALRGVIMTMSLYLPAKTSASQATNCGEQVVVFAFVFVAVRLTWQLVVRLAGPTSFHSPVHSPVLPPMEQTLYESKNVAVEGCPRAVVTDPTYLDSVRAAYSKELDEEKKEDDSDYWNLVTKTPNQVNIDRLGVTEEQRASATAEVGDAWNEYFQLLTYNGKPEVPQKENDLSVSVQTVNSLLAFNGTRPNQAPTTTLAETYVKELAFLDYTNLPVVAKPKVDKKSPKNEEGPKNARKSPPVRSPAPAAAARNAKEAIPKIHINDLMALPDDKFLWNSMPSKHGLDGCADNCRMSLKRLAVKVQSLRQNNVTELLIKRDFRIWNRIAKLLKEGKAMPPWMFTQPIHSSRFQVFLVSLRHKFLPDKIRWSNEDVAKARTNCLKIAEERAITPTAKTGGSKSSKDNKRKRGERDKAALAALRAVTPASAALDRPARIACKKAKTQAPQKGAKAKEEAEEEEEESEDSDWEEEDEGEEEEDEESTAPGVTMEQVRNVVDESLTAHDAVLQGMVDGAVTQVREAMQAVGTDVKDMQAERTVRAEAGLVENKLEIAKNIIKMLMQPYKMQTALQPAAGSSSVSVKNAMEPYVTCARQIAGMNLQNGNGFDADEVEELFGREEKK